MCLKKIRGNSLDFSEDIPVSIQSLVLDSWIQDGGQQWTCHLDICTTLNGHNFLKIWDIGIIFFSKLSTKIARHVCFTPLFPNCNPWL